MNVPTHATSIQRMRDARLKKLSPRRTPLAASLVAQSGSRGGYLGHVPPGQFGKVRRKMVHRLIRMKALNEGRLLGHFLIALDGAGQLTFSQRHCEHCLTRTTKGKTIYFHHVLEAKLICPNGLAISVGAEFIENAAFGDLQPGCQRASATIASGRPHWKPSAPASRSVWTICE